MTRVLVAPAAAADLKRLTTTHSLPADTPGRVRRTIEPLARFPRLGAPLEGRWNQHRFVLGPWRWMLIVYVYDSDADIVAVVTIEDGRSATAANSER